MNGTLGAKPVHWLMFETKRPIQKKCAWRVLHFWLCGAYNSLQYDQREGPQPMAGVANHPLLIVTTTSCLKPVRVDLLDNRTPATALGDYENHGPGPTH